MRNRLQDRQGFTLIELMIVVVIIGILAALAIPRFQRASVRTKQSEARLILKQIYVNQHAYRQQSVANNYYQPAGPASAVTPAVMHDIWIDIMPSARYVYVVAAGPNAFTATATSNIDDDATVDTWVVDESGVMTNTVNDVNT